MVQAHKNMKIEGDRLWQSLMAMAEIGPGVAGGNNRQARQMLTESHIFSGNGEDAGLTMTLTRWHVCSPEGTDPEALPIMCSHLDTQPTGGRYDGVLGEAGL